MRKQPFAYIQSGGANPPTVTTGTITSGNITGNSASMGGSQVTSDGGGTVTARGAVWSTSINPTIVLTTKTVDGSGLGTFTSNITGLSANTTYYVRAYATNSAGTTYGSEISFTTDTVPTVTTSVTNVAATTATMNGNVTSDGGATVSSRGIAYNTGGTPTTSDTSITVGSGTGEFTTNITGLTAGTTYYVRAWAVNPVGLAYGNQVGFSTPNPQPPTVTAGYDDLGGNQYRFYVTVNSIGSATPSEVGVIVNGSTYYVEYYGGTGTFYIPGTFGPYSPCAGPSYTAFATNTVGTGTSGGSITIPGNPPTSTIANNNTRRQGTVAILDVAGIFSSPDSPVIFGIIDVYGPSGEYIGAANMSIQSGGWVAGLSKNNGPVGNWVVYGQLINGCGAVNLGPLTVYMP